MVESKVTKSHQIVSPLILSVSYMERMGREGKEVAEGDPSTRYPSKISVSLRCYFYN